MGCTVSKNEVSSNEIEVKSKNNKLSVQEKRRLSSHSRIDYVTRRGRFVVPLNPQVTYHKDIPVVVEDINRASSLTLLVNNVEVTNVNSQAPPNDSEETSFVSKKQSHAEILRKQSSNCSEYLFDVLKYSPGSLKRNSVEETDSLDNPQMFLYPHLEQESNCSTVSNSLRSYCTTLDSFASNDKINRYDLDEFIKLKQQLNTEELKILHDFVFP